MPGFGLSWRGRTSLIHCTVPSSTYEPSAPGGEKRSVSRVPIERGCVAPDEDAHLRDVGDGRVEERVIGLAVHEPGDVEALGRASVERIRGGDLVLGVLAGAVRVAVGAGLCARGRRTARRVGRMVRVTTAPGHESATSRFPHAHRGRSTTRSTRSSPSRVAGAARRGMRREAHDGGSPHADDAAADAVLVFRPARHLKARLTGEEAKVERVVARGEVGPSWSSWSSTTTSPGCHRPSG